jgi:hypothetical protein
VVAGVVAGTGDSAAVTVAALVVEGAGAAVVVSLVVAGATPCVQHDKTGPV